MAKAKEPKFENHPTRFIQRMMVCDPETGIEHEIEIRKDTVNNMLIGLDITFVEGPWTDVFCPYTGRYKLDIGRNKTQIGGQA